MKKLFSVALALVMVFGGVIGLGLSEKQVASAASTSTPPPAAINQVFPDETLANIVASSLTMEPTDQVTQGQLNLITNFTVFEEHITDISGIEHLTRLRTLNLSRNDITDISPLLGANFIQLQVLNLEDQVIDYPVIPWQENIQMTNNIRDLNSALIAPSLVSNGGSYSSPTVEWETTSYVPNLFYTFTTPVTISGIETNFSGTVNQPLETLFIVTFYVDGEIYDDEEVESGMLVPPVEDPIKEGYVFTGWNTEEDGSGDMWAFGSNVMPESDLDLYAQWDKEIDINVNGNGGGDGNGNGNIDINARGPRTGADNILPIVAAVMIISIAGMVYMMRRGRKIK